MSVRETCNRPGCDRLANVTYRATTDHPVPRCWDHAPRLHEAIAAGLLDPPGPEHRAHPRPRTQAPAEPDPWPWSDDREARELDASERAYERYIGRT